MTITVRRSTAAILIALLGILGGLAIGQVTQAVSSNPQANSSAANYQLRQINRNLRDIRVAVGSSSGIHTVLRELDRIKANTYGTCQDARYKFYCRN